MTAPPMARRALRVAHVRHEVLHDLVVADVGRRAARQQC
jgi:hypothetical protein